MCSQYIISHLQGHFAAQLETWHWISTVSKQPTGLTFYPKLYTAAI